LDLNQIRYFLTLSETLNFSRAAEMHDITQPALTKAVQKLEEELGGILIYRDGKDTRLSPLGKKVQIQFERISKSEDRVREVARDYNAQGYTMINIGISPTLGGKRIVAPLMQFASGNTKVEITLHQTDPETTEEMILSGALDCAFCTQMSNRPNPKIRSFALFEEPLLLACSERHRFAEYDSVSPHDLVKEPYLDRLHCEFRADMAERLKMMGLMLDPVLRSDREDWIQELVSQGFGITALPESSKVMPGIVLVPITGTNLSRTIYFTSIFGSATSEIVQRLAKFVETVDWDTGSVG